MALSRHDVDAFQNIDYVVDASSFCAFIPRHNVTTKRLYNIQACHGCSETTYLERWWHRLDLVSGCQAGHIYQETYLAPNEVKNQHVQADKSRRRWQLEKHGIAGIRVSLELVNQL